MPDPSCEVTVVWRSVEVGICPATCIDMLDGLVGPVAQDDGMSASGVCLIETRYRNATVAR